MAPQGDHTAGNLFDLRVRSESIGERLQRYEWNTIAEVNGNTGVLPV
jgi:hypothetical protein